MGMKRLLAMLISLSQIGCSIARELEKGIQSSRSSKSYIGRSTREVAEAFGAPLRTRETLDGSVILYFKDRWYLTRGDLVVDGNVFSEDEYTIKLTSIFDRETKPFAKGATYEIFSGANTVPNNDLSFKEFARALTSSLVDAGLKRQRVNPDYIILLKVGISDPMVEVETISRPVFVWVPGSTSYVNGYSSSGSYHGSVTTSGYTQYAGNSLEQRKTTTFKRYAQILVYDSKTIKDEEPKMVSKVVLESVGQGDDLRAVGGVMCSLAGSFIAKNTNGKQIIAINTADPSTYVFYEH